MDQPSVTGSPPRPRRVRNRKALLVGLAIVGVSAGVAAPLSAPNLRRTLALFAAPPSATIAVTMSGRAISPREVHVPRDAAVKVVVSNLDGPRDGHRLKTTGQFYDVDVATWGGLAKSDVILTAREPGRYAILCSIRGHADEGMVAVLVVD